MDEGRAFTFTVTRNGGSNEETFVLVTVTDSAFPGTPAGAVVRNNGPGGRIVEFDVGQRSATGTMTPALDGARPGSRTLRVKLETAHVDLGESERRAELPGGGVRYADAAGARPRRGGAGRRCAGAGRPGRDSWIFG